MRIILTGTPGVGKSKLALLFAARLRYNRLDLNATIVKDKLYSGYDRQRRSYITDMRRVIGYLRKTTAKGDWIIDSHLAHLLPKGLVDVVLVLRCAPIELEKRLKTRRWPEAKINENIEAELIGLIAWEARQKHDKVYDIDTTSKSVKQVVGIVEKVLKDRGEGYRKQIEWLS